MARDVLNKSKLTNFEQMIIDKSLNNEYRYNDLERFNKLSVKHKTVNQLIISLIWLCSCMVVFHAINPLEPWLEIGIPGVDSYLSHFGVFGFMFIFISDWVLTHVIFSICNTYDKIEMFLRRK